MLLQPDARNVGDCIFSQAEEMWSLICNVVPADCASRASIFERALELFLRAFARFATGPSSREFSLQCAYSHALNAAIDVERATLNGRLNDHEFGDQTSLTEEQHARLAMWAITSPTRRAALLLRDGLSIGVKEISSITDTASKNLCSNRISVARTKLRQFAPWLRPGGEAVQIPRLLVIAVQDEPDQLVNQRPCTPADFRYALQIFRRGLARLAPAVESPDFDD